MTQHETKSSMVPESVSPEEVATKDGAGRAEWLLNPPRRSLLYRAIVWIVSLGFVTIAALYFALIAALAYAIYYFGVHYYNLLSPTHLSQNAIIYYACLAAAIAVVILLLLPFFGHEEIHELVCEL